MSSGRMHQRLGKSMRGVAVLLTDIVVHMEFAHLPMMNMPKVQKSIWVTAMRNRWDDKAVCLVCNCQADYLYVLY